MARVAAGLIALALLVAFSLTIASPPESFPDLDLDIDSDNDDGLSPPARSTSEDAVEDVPGNPAFPGKFVQVNDNDDDATGFPKPDATPVPTEFVGVSDPRPGVVLDEVSSSAVVIDAAAGTGTVTIQGIVRDPIADDLPRGEVSKRRADIEAIAVGGQDNGPGAFWRQHPYRGTLGPIAVSIPIEEGTHIIRVWLRCHQLP